MQATALTKHYNIKRKNRQELVKALDGVDLNLPEGLSTGLVGESGCGKSTLLRLLLLLERPTTGAIRFRGEDLYSAGENNILTYRSAIQAVFQDAGASLNPRLPAGESIAEPLINLKPDLNRFERAKKVAAALEQVGLDRGNAKRYPHEISGGQQRRVALARALIAQPKLILCDEATSGLDVSVQAQLLNLLLDLQEQQGLHYFFVSHDLAVVRYLCPQLMVMYGGRIVEELPSAKLSHPLHPYTKALAASELGLQRKSALKPLAGEPPDPANFPAGCRFYDRCPERLERCRKEYPALRQIEKGHNLSCWLGD